MNSLTADPELILEGLFCQEVLNLGNLNMPVPGVEIFHKMANLL